MSTRFCATARFAERGRALGRAWGYVWASPVTAFGLLMALLARCGGGRVQVRGGVVEAEGGLLRRLFALRFPLFGAGAAMTLGHVILARDAECLRRSQAHVRQFEQWGALLLPVYFFAGLWAKHKGLDPHLHNPFEREAYRAGEGGGV